MMTMCEDVKVMINKSGILEIFENLEYLKVVSYFKVVSFLPPSPLPPSPFQLLIKAANRKKKYEK